jgi:hypothetical protein
MKWTICGNEFVLIAMGVFSSFKRHNSFKDKSTWKFQESLSLDYKCPKRGQNSPEAPTWRNVMFNRARAWGTCIHSSKFGQLCTAVCTNTYCISCIFQIYEFLSLKWCNGLCAQLFGFTIRSFKKGHPSTWCKHRYTIKGTDQ